jgi:hypothetical protein
MYYIYRKDLMAWRSERSQQVRHTMEECTRRFGLRGIELRTSWSSQNNIMLINRLLDTLAPQEGEGAPPSTIDH